MIHERRPYYKLSEHFHVPCGTTMQEAGAFYNPDSFGSNGPIHIAYPEEFSASHRLWHETLNGLDVPTNRDHVGGSNVGVWTNLCSIDPDSFTRSYAASSPRPPSLVILGDALVEELILETDNEELVATGVAFSCGQRRFTAHSKHEVVLCAGSIQSPQLLELSGIGNPDVLGRAGIDVKVVNPTVGENLQDHISKPKLYKLPFAFWNAFPAYALCQSDHHRL